MKGVTTLLSSLRTGDRCVIDSFLDETMKQKLLEMGCLPGETVTIDRFAPFGCPMAITISGSTLSLRLDEASFVVVKQIA